MNENSGKSQKPKYYDKDNKFLITELNEEEYTEYKRKLESEYGWTFEGPFYTEAPSPKPEYVGDNLQRLQHLRDRLLTTVIIRDQFDKDHWTRRSFYTQQGSELIQFVKNYSKLKRGKMIVAVGALSLLQQYLAQQNPELHRKIAEIFIPDEHRQALEQYNDMELEQKIQYAKRVDDVVYRCLEVLSQ